METSPLPRSDPSLIAVFGFCLLLVPVEGACALIGALIGLCLGLSGDWIWVTVMAAVAVLTVPAWTWLFHLYMRGHWRLQVTV